MPKPIPTVAAIFAILLLIICQWSTSTEYIIRHLNLDSETAPSLGDWGDGFGAVSAVFSAATIAGLILTIWMQFNIAKEQRQSGEKQDFDRVFFQIFNLIREQRAALKISPRPSTSGITHQPAATIPAKNYKTYEGPEAIKITFRLISLALSSGKNTTTEGRRKVVTVIESVISTEYESQLSPYFRLTYTLMKRIHRSRVLSREEKDDYSRLLRSQMTSEEAALLGFNGLAPASKDLAFYITQLSMLKYTHQGHARDILEAHYPPKAFDRNADRNM